MRAYTDAILEEIRQELNLIFALHRVHRLEGKMRLFSVANQEFWQSHESGFEFFFGPDEIDRAINKIQLFYRGGHSPNTAFLLDPILYRFEGETPKPLGSGILWCTVLCREGEEISDEALARVRALGLFATPLVGERGERAGVKIFGITKKPAAPLNEHLMQDGSVLPGIQALADLVDVNSDHHFIKSYLLSGLEYRSKIGTYQHPKFMDLFGEKRIATIHDMRANSVYLQKVTDAGICWNAYDRNPDLYARYGIDVANLKRNIKGRIDSDRGIDEVKRELGIIWAAHLAHGLQGKMRLFTAPNQDHLRSKQPGVEVWFGPDEVDQAIEQMKLYYNGGLLPNSPFVLDPIVYRPEADGTYTPHASSVVWATALMVGSQSVDEDALERVRKIGALGGHIKRGIDRMAGIKALAFLEKPYFFDEAALRALNPEDYREKSEEELLELEIASRVESLKHDAKADDAALQQGDKAPKVRDAIPIPGCRELLEIINGNSEEYYPYYLLSGLEYLTAHGAYSSETFESLIPLDQLQSLEDITSHYVAPQHIVDAALCWNEYDREQSLWDRFGIDAKNLKENLKYFNLCARDFSLLDATGMDRKNADETFDFLVPGWIPMGAVTLVGASGGTGKSSAVHRLLTMSAIDWREDEEKPTWLGQPISWEHCDGVCIHFSGEDGPPIVNARLALYDPERRAKRFMMQRTDFGKDESGQDLTISQFLRKLHKLPKVTAVVIDPARKYLTGDEEDSESVSEFFEAIEEFAIEKHCAMIVVHHLVRRAYPKDTRECLDMLRGSQVFIDRPRVVIGMFREGPYVVCGLAKNNIPPSLGMVQGERVFARDPEKLDLVQLPGEKGVRSFTISEDELEQIKLEAEATKQLEAIAKDKKPE